MSPADDVLRGYVAPPARPVQSGTGAEPWLLGWKLAGGSWSVQEGLVLADDVLRGYVARKVAKAKGEPTDLDAALAAWTRES